MFPLFFSLSGHFGGVSAVAMINSTPFAELRSVTLMNKLEAAIVFGRSLTLDRLIRQRSQAFRMRVLFFRLLIALLSTEWRVAISNPRRETLFTISQT